MTDGRSTRAIIGEMYAKFLSEDSPVRQDMLCLEKKARLVLKAAGETDLNDEDKLKDAMLAVLLTDLENGREMPGLKAVREWLESGRD